MDLIEPAPDGRGNLRDYTVSELSAAVKRVVEGEFGLVRVRGEIGRVSRPASGHLYFALKDDRAVLDAVAWRSQAQRLGLVPEEGLEVVATGRLSTFPGQSKYQLIVEQLALAGLGALMAMLEKRKAQLAAEGLFDAARKRPLPYLPRVIGVVTSPSGAVIRDILHRLRDRFPLTVLIWPVAVQGERCAPEVAAAIRGFNALPPDGPVPRPDLLIVARGGGSLEDLMGFNDEAVVRAAAASEIPLISAVGHETDTTLIDLAADRRAPTPTAAAEMAVPVRADLLAALAGLAARLAAGGARAARLRRQRLADLARALPRPEVLLESPRQRLDLLAQRLPAALAARAARARVRLAAAGLRPELLRRLLAGEARRLAQAARHQAAAARRLSLARHELARLAGRLDPARLAAACDRRRADLGRLGASLAAAAARRLAAAADRLAALERLRQTLGHSATLARGFALVRAGGRVVTTAEAAARAPALELEFRDGSLTARPDTAPRPPRPARAGGGAADGAQGSLF
jgi:exodeoxyribonuclease VII large subunit